MRALSSVDRIREAYELLNARQKEAESLGSEDVKETINKEIEKTFSDIVDPIMQKLTEEEREELKSRINNEMQLQKISEMINEAKQEESEPMVVQMDENFSGEDLGNKLLQKTEAFRKSWEESVDLDGETKDKIIEAVDKISSEPWFDIKEGLDGDRLIEFELNGKKYKLLDVNILAHAEDQYRRTIEYYGWGKKEEEEKLWMAWHNLDEWNDGLLKEYVLQKQEERFRIPKIEEMKKFLWKLGKKAGLEKLSDQIAMLMYLTGMYWTFWLDSWTDEMSDPDLSSRSIINCEYLERHRGFSFYSLKDDFAGLFMINF